MGESLPIAENPAHAAKDSSEENPKEKSRSQKVVIGTALMTAITTIAVSFIGIVPQLRNSDAATIQGLKQDLNQLVQKVSASESKAPVITSDKKMNIQGKIRSEDGKRTLNGVEVYLLPEDNYRLTTKTDDSGVFNFQGIPAGQYSIIIRDSSGGRSGKGLLDETGEEVKVMGGVIKYRIK
ncbi:MAG TPA: carboxypeptidase-like regulatory domain-containing protein [Pyrinomonadaceae bacterium]|nr:carboxypeptidase-like regulatory domain-containing protein [Pyrinomonadaceae bacterium]